MCSASGRRDKRLPQHKPDRPVPTMTGRGPLESPPTHRTSARRRKRVPVLRSMVVLVSRLERGGYEEVATARRCQGTLVLSVLKGFLEQRDRFSLYHAKFHSSHQKRQSTPSSLLSSSALFPLPPSSLPCQTLPSSRISPRNRPVFISYNLSCREKSSPSRLGSAGTRSVLSSGSR